MEPYFCSLGVQHGTLWRHLLHLFFHKDFISLSDIVMAGRAALKIVMAGRAALNIVMAGRAALNIVLAGRAALNIVMTHC